MNILIKICVVIFVISISKSDSTAQKDLAFKKKAYQSSTIGFFDKAEKAVDGDRRTCSDIKQIFSPSWWIVDLGRPYYIGRVRVITWAKLGSFHVLTMNNFDASSNPPKASVHNVCGKSGEEGLFDRTSQLNISCSRETRTTLYQYVALWTQNLFGLHVCEVNVFEDSTDLAFKKQAYQSSTVGILNKAKKAVDGDWSTCSQTQKSSDPSWWIVDLGRPYYIGGVYVFVKLNLGSFHILTMNDFDASSNPPKASVHNVCWKSGDEGEDVTTFRLTTTCSRKTLTTLYQYVALWTPKYYGLHVCELNVLEGVTTKTALTPTTTSSTAARQQTSPAARVHVWLGSHLIFLSIFYVLAA